MRGVFGGRNLRAILHLSTRWICTTRTYLTHRGRGGGRVLAAVASSLAGRVLRRAGPGRAGPGREYSGRLLSAIRLIYSGQVDW